jgi:hypothetical protein
LLLSGTAFSPSYPLLQLNEVQATDIVDD